MLHINSFTTQFGSIQPLGNFHRSLFGSVKFSKNSNRSQHWFVQNLQSSLQSPHNLIFSYKIFLGCIQYLKKRFRSEGSSPISTGGTLLGSIGFFYDFSQQYKLVGSLLTSMEPLAEFSQKPIFCSDPNPVKDVISPFTQASTASVKFYSRAKTSKATFQHLKCLVVTEKHLGCRFFSFVFILFHYYFTCVALP